MNGLLSLLIFLPVVGTLVVLFVPREKPSVIRWVTTLFAGAEFLLSVPLWTFAGFRKSGDFFFRETHDWIPSLGAKYSLGVDGIAALLILLTTLLSFISVYASFSAITKREKEYYAFLLLLETGMVGVFCALAWKLASKGVKTIVLDAVILLADTLNVAGTVGAWIPGAMK